MLTESNLLSKQTIFYFCFHWSNWIEIIPILSTSFPRCHLDLHSSNTKIGFIALVLWYFPCYLWLLPVFGPRLFKTANTNSKNSKGHLHTKIWQTQDPKPRMHPFDKQVLSTETQKVQKLSKLKWLWKKHFEKRPITFFSEGVRFASVPT